MTGGLFAEDAAADPRVKPEEEAIADARRWGMDEATIADLRSTLEPDDTEGVWPENEAAVRAFLAVATQWRTLPGPLKPFWIGLDYSAALAGLAASGITVTPDLWARLQAIEAAARAALNEG